MRRNKVDVIISANDEIKRMIKDITLNEEGKVSPEDFQKMVLTIIQERNKNVIQKV